MAEGCWVFLLIQFRIQSIPTDYFYLPPLPRVQTNKSDEKHPCLDGFPLLLRKHAAFPPGTQVTPMVTPPAPATMASGPSLATPGAAPHQGHLQMQQLMLQRGDLALDPSARRFQPGADR